MITELGVFTVTALLMGKLETSSLAGHEIAIQTSEFFLAIPLAFSYSATARIGQMMGEKNTVGLLRAAFVNLAFSVLFAFIVAIGFELFASPIVSLYLDMNNPDNALAISRGINFLKLAGVYQIFRSIQFIAVGALLGLQDTLVPMLINTLSLWGIGLGGGYIMAITLGWEGIGFWYGLTLGMAISGLILIMRFNLINFTKIAEHESGKLEVEPDEKSLSK